MAKPKYCPECGDALLGEKCTCGWRSSARRGGKGYKPDTRCSFTDGARRCPQAGSITSAVHGPAVGQPDDRTWYCRWHYRTRGDGHQGSLLLDDMAQNPGAYRADSNG